MATCKFGSTLMTLCPPLVSQPRDLPQALSGRARTPCSFSARASRSEGKANAQVGRRPVLCRLRRSAPSRGGAEREGAYDAGEDGSFGEEEDSFLDVSQGILRNRGRLKLFLDSADVADWEDWLPTGAIYGVTTNPLLLQRAGQRCDFKNLKNLALQALAMGAEEVQVQTLGDSVKELFTFGTDIYEIAPGRIVVKVPATKDGITAARDLTDEGVRVTMTAIYKPQQILLAAAVGADYAAPYLGRMSDNGLGGQEEILSMQAMVESCMSDMQILVASIRNAGQVVSLAASGLECFALPTKIVEEMFSVDITEKAAQEFEKAAQA